MTCFLLLSYEFDPGKAIVNDLRLEDMQSIVGANYTYGWLVDPTLRRDISHVALASIYITGCDHVVASSGKNL